MAGFLRGIRAIVSGISPIPGSLYVGYRGFFHGCYEGPETNSLHETHPQFNKGHTFNGVGTFHSAYEGKTFSGKWSKNILGPETGDSVMLLKNSDLYIGELQYGRPSGFGKLIFGQTRDSRGHRQSNRSRYNFDASNYDAYEGSFKEGLPHYFGKLTWKTGITYSGEFKKGKKDGVFTAEFPDGLKLWLLYKQDELEGVSFSSDLSQLVTPKRVRLKYKDRLLFEKPSPILNPSPTSIINKFLSSSKSRTFPPARTALILDNNGTGAFYYHGEVSANKPNGKGFMADFDLGMNGGYITEEGNFKDEWLHGEGTRTITTEKFKIEGPNVGAGLLEVKASGNFVTGSAEALEKHEHWIVPLPGYQASLGNVSKPKATKPEITPLGPGDNKGMHDIHGDPEKRARRVVRKSEKPKATFMVADGGLYVKGALGGVFSRAKPVRFDLESTPIIHDPRTGIVEIDYSGEHYEFTGLGRLSNELVDAMRRERADKYPESLHTKKDKEQFPNLNWDSKY